jgi:hypothetical protein
MHAPCGELPALAAGRLGEGESSWKRAGDGLASFGAAFAAGGGVASRVAAVSLGSIVPLCVTADLSSEAGAAGLLSAVAAAWAEAASSFFGESGAAGACSKQSATECSHY